MKDFYIQARHMTINDESFWYVQYWWNTDLRTDSKTKEFPISRVLDWCSK